MILAIIRLGTVIAIPGIDVVGVKVAMESGSAGTLYNIIAGGANSRWSVFAMGIGPYITSSVIMQLLTIAIPKLEQLSKEGEEGRKKVQSYSRYLTVALALIQGIGVTYSYKSMFLSNSPIVYVGAVVSLVCGSTFIMWLAEQITAKGVGNGSSLVIFINIVSNLPAGLTGLYMTATGSGVTGWAKVIGVIVVLLVVLVFIVLLNGGERRLPVQYSSKMAGRKQVGGRST